MTRMSFLGRVPATLLVAFLGMLSGCEQLVSVETRITRAEKLLDSGAYTEALLELKNALDDQPGFQQAATEFPRPYPKSSP